MKKTLWMAVLIFCLCLLASSALAGTAQVITNRCAITISSGKKARVKAITDGKATTVFETAKEKKPHIEVAMKDGQRCYGLSIIWPETPKPYEIWVPDGKDGWRLAKEGNTNGFVHDYIALDGYERFRICPKEENSVFKIADLTLLSEGELPDTIQVWEKTPQKADMLLLLAHPDDEYIFMGGTIPYYACEEKKSIVVAYMTYASPKRRTELLNGLWTAGQRTYPIMGEFKDKYFNKLADAYKLWGEDETRRFVEEIIEAYSPLVVVTHDINGEYGHGAHRLCADVAIKAVAAGDTGVQKLYLHLYKENPIRLDWKKPLASFSGETALSVAKRAYKCHASQQGGQVKYRGKVFKFQVVSGGMFDNSAFGLYYSTLGEDVLKNDFFENVTR